MASDEKGKGIITSSKDIEHFDPGKTIERKIFGRQLISDQLRDPLSVFGNPAVQKAAKEAENQKKLIAKQEREEAARKAAAASDIAERKAASRPGIGGRSLLIATSPTGTRAQTLGGV